MTHLLTFLFLTFAYAGPPQPIGFVDGLEGSGSAVVIRQGKSYGVQKPHGLFEGDELHTGDKVAVRIRYLDGSKQLLASNTRVRLHVQDGIPAPEFIEGAVDSQVTPAMNPKPFSKPSGKARFLFRTKSVVLGVRGTEFVVHTGPKGLEVHTLKGVVEAARDPRDLGTAKAIAIKEAFEVVGIAGTEIPAPSAFVPAEFLGKVGQKYPELVKLLK